MEKQEAKKYPLFKDYEFGVCLGNPMGGLGTLLIPKKEIYIPKQYGFGELRLAPYIQEIFNKESKITVQNLIKELKEETEISLLAHIRDEEWFLEEVIRKFSKHRIIDLRKMNEETGLYKYDILAKGANYDYVCVYNMAPYTNSNTTFNVFSDISQPPFLTGKN